MKIPFACVVLLLSLGIASAQVGVQTPPPPQSRVVAPPGSQWRPSDKEKQSVEQLTLQYFAAKDRGNYDQAFALLTKSIEPGWEASSRQFNAKSGNVKSRRIKNVTWYKDPPSGPGVYAAVDFMSQFENIDIHCGYVVWHQQADGSFRLLREEQNYIDKATQQGLEEKVLAAIKAKFGC